MQFFTLFNLLSHHLSMFSTKSFHASSSPPSRVLQNQDCYTKKKTNIRVYVLIGKRSISLPFGCFAYVDLTGISKFKSLTLDDISSGASESQSATLPSFFLKSGCLGCTYRDRGIKQKKKGNDFGKCRNHLEKFSYRSVLFAFAVIAPFFRFIKKIKPTISSKVSSFVQAS